jgi:hypothetical protein
MKRIALLAMVMMAFGAVTVYAVPCDNPVKDTIDQTASIKAMQSKPYNDRGYVRNLLGNKVATCTDNSGKTQLGR